MARLFRKLKGRSLLCAVGLLAVTIFLFLQIFSFKVLLGSGDKGRQSRENIIPPEKRGVQGSLGKSLEDLKKGFEKLIGPRKHKEKHLSQVNLNAQSGVRPSLRHLYEPNVADKFRCLQSKELIDFSKVNDDYCDCEDSTDEPGTAACSHDTHSRFYCSFQVSDTEPLIIFSSRVNDGICDCCDGSDEWGNARVPSELQVKDSDRKTYAAVHAPCYDLCDELREGKLLLEKIVAQGRLVKQEYIKFAKDQLNPNEIYGPNGEFMKLKEKCHSLRAGEFEYDICPFQSVRQNSFPKSHKILGRSSVWVSRGEEGVWKLKMEDGDKDLCPGGVDRQVLFEFHCGLEDEVVKLSELEKCRYQIIMRTPAAC